MKTLIALSLILLLAGCATICEVLPQFDIDLNPLCEPTPTPVVTGIA